MEEDSRGNKSKSKGDSYYDSQPKVMFGQHEDQGEAVFKDRNHVENDVPPIKIRKLQYDDELYKPPCSEELHTLKETANLFHSTLFRLQVEEMLNEVKVKPKTEWREWIERLMSVLLSIPDGKSYDLNNPEWIRSTGIQIPIRKGLSKTKGVFQFVAPTTVKIIGGYPVGLVLKPNVTIDLGVQMPKECFRPSDFVNHRYHQKRALYLLCLTQYLQTCDLISTMKFTYFHGDCLKPVLLVKPEGKLSKKFQVCIYPYPPRDVFRLSRLAGCRNNIRISHVIEGLKENEEPPTPRYNSSILADMLIEQNCDYVRQVITDVNSVKDAIILLQIWTKHRQLDTGLGGFSPFIQKMFILYVLQMKKLNNLMSSYQIVRSVWVYLAKRDWMENGITLNQNSNGNKELNDFKALFEVVFVDPSGLLNFAANMSLTTLEQVRYEAEMAVFLLDNRSNSFDALFLSPASFVSRFDHAFHVVNSSLLIQACTKLNISASLIDNTSPSLVILPNLIEYLREGLGKRIRLLGVHLRPPPVWCITDSPPDVDSIHSLLIGILLDPVESISVMEKGPSAETPEAVKFRKFWGDVCDLRHFPDGTICETVVWPCNTVSNKRSVCKSIVYHILSRHLDISTDNIHYFCDELEDIINYQLGSCHLTTTRMKSTGEEATLKILHDFDQLAKHLRNLDGLVLAINSIIGISPVFRYTEIFPPVSSFSRMDLNVVNVVGNRMVLKMLPKYCPYLVFPFEVLIQFEGSGKWPQDVEALRRLKTAFYIKLGKLLQRQYSHTTVINPDHIDVLINGYVFRIVIANHREISAMKAFNVNGMIKFENTDQSKTLEMKIVTLPKITSVLHSLQMENASYSVTCQLAKRWISSQLLFGHISDVTIELLVAYLYLEPQPFCPPSSPQIGFLRFLQLLSRYDWRNNPLIVNFNNILSKKDISEVHTKFLSARDQLPAMFIATPQDDCESPWTKSMPTPLILNRLIVLAKEAHKVFEAQLTYPSDDFDYKTIFRPPLEPYDVIIHLNPMYVPNRHMGVEVKVREPKRTTQLMKYEIMPVINFNPVISYLKDLQDSFDEFAVFFYDHCGGLYIAVLWKPSSFHRQPFKVVNASGRMITGEREDSLETIPNISAIVEDFANLGQGLVTSVETLTERWTFIE